MNPVLENRMIEELVDSFDRSPAQLNGLHEADAELVLLPYFPGSVLAATTDSISEELSTGLYADPYLAGWMSVMVSMSDLAAVGARPLGLLLSEILPDGFDTISLRSLQKGVREACRACETHLLGGDTNSGAQMVLTGTALGVCRDGTPLSRVGCKPGDRLFTTGPLGTGNAFALRIFSHLLGRADSRPTGGRRVNAVVGENSGGKYVEYRPQARLREGDSIRGIATACMDTSDGVLTTLDQLMRLNGVGFELNAGWEDVLSRCALAEFRAHGFPAWFALAGHHGEFELLFTVPESRLDRLVESSEESGWRPRELGRATVSKEVTLPLYGRVAALDTGFLRNLSFQCASNPGVYVGALLEYDATIRKGAINNVSA